MVDDASHQWYERQKADDHRSRDRSESLLGLERAIFAEAMNLIVRLIDAVLTADTAQDRLADLAFKHKIALVNYGFNLLWSAWNEALAGRYHTATDHFRSIEECPDYLTALWLDPQLSDKWTDVRRLEINKARETIKKSLDMPRKGAGADLLKQMQDLAKSRHPLSHVSVQSLSQYLPAIEKDGKRWLVVRLGGAVSRLTLRIVAIQVATSALELLSAALLAFDEILEIELDLFQTTTAKIRALTGILAEEIKALSGDGGGPAAGIYFVRSDETI